MRFFALLAPIGVLFFASCAPNSDSSSASGENGETDVEDQSGAKTIEEMREEALAEIDVEACEAGGGAVRQDGLLGLPRCITPYADAGKVCADESECEGRCIAADGVTDFDAAPGEAEGRCEANDSPFGCYAEISNGVAGAMLCVD